MRLLPDAGADHSSCPHPHPLFLGHKGIDYQPYLGKGFFSFSTKAFCPPPFFFFKNKLEAIPMINYQLPNALPLAISGKGMNYLEKHPKREPTVKENQKGYLAVHVDSSSWTGLLVGPSEEGSRVAGPIIEGHVQPGGEWGKASGSREQYGEAEEAEVEVAFPVSI